MEGDKFNEVRDLIGKNVKALVGELVKDDKSSESTRPSRQAGVSPASLSQNRT